MISLKTRYSDYIFNDPVYNIIACFYFNPNQIETNLPITQIAYNLGFHSLVHMSRYFSHHKRMSPSDYRRRYDQAQ